MKDSDAIMKWFLEIINNVYINQLIDVDAYDFCNIATYHRIDMILVDYLNSFNLSTDNKKELLRKQSNVINQNHRFITELLELNLDFSKNSISYILLKGCSMMLEYYKKDYHRYFGDIDILVSLNDIEDILKILCKNGYTQGDVIDNKIRQATRKEILFKQLNTHEIYNLVKLDKDYHELTIDVNFKFSWKGLPGNEIIEPNYKELLRNITPALINSVKIPILTNEYQFIHLCIHFYNEAVYFALNNDYVGGSDPREILLFRMLDILIVSMKEDLDIEKIQTLVQQMNCVYKIVYVLSLFRTIVGVEYVEKFKKYFFIAEQFPNYFASPKGSMIEWPITLYQRLFDLNSKTRALNELSNEGLI
jgi:hypothetical protein